MKKQNMVSYGLGKKTLAVLMALGVIASIGYFGVNSVLADYNNPMHDSIVSKIAQKFNLNEADVEAVFDSVREERQDEMKKQREESLSKAVSDGVINNNQKEAIIAKMAEHFGEKVQNREEMQNWFKEQGIDETKLRSYLRPNNNGRGMRGGR